MPDTIETLRDQALDMRVLRWSDTNKGATVTLDLHPDDIAKNGGIHPFKGREGRRFKVLLWEIADDETTPPPSPSPQRSEKAKETRRAMTPMQRAPGDAAMLLDDRAYRDWIIGRYGARLAPGTPMPEIERGYVERLQKLVLGIDSKAELGTDELAYRRWIAHKTEFEQAVGRMARG